MNKEIDRDSKYWDILSTRLVEERTAQGLSQQDLADRTDIPRTKIAYAELNTKGRKLQIEDLAKIAEELKVSTDYLLGLTNSKTSTNNGLADYTNKIFTNWGNDTLELFDKLVEEFESNWLNEDLKAYVFVAYINKNILTKTLQDIKVKVADKQELQSIEVQKVQFLIDYLEYFKTQKINDYKYIEFLLGRYATQFETAKSECTKLLNYNTVKQSKINIDSIEGLKTIFEAFENHILYALENTIKLSMENMTDRVTEDNKYFNKIKKFFKEVQPL